MFVNIYPKFIVLLCVMFISFAFFSSKAAELNIKNIHELSQELKIGDIVFVRIDTLPFRKIARDTGSWVNHVGIVIELKDNEPQIAESTFPLSKITPLSKFVERSENYRVAVRRLNTGITAKQIEKMQNSARSKLGIFYDTGFDLYSEREFCSRYVREVVSESTGVKLGKIQTLKELFADNPDADLVFWKIWYLGMIPWHRDTVTPASVLSDDINTYFIFDGYVNINKTVEE